MFLLFGLIAQFAHSIVNLRLASLSDARLKAELQPSLVKVLGLLDGAGGKGHRRLPD